MCLAKNFRQNGADEKPNSDENQHSDENTNSDKIPNKAVLLLDDSNIKDTFSTSTIKGINTSANKWLKTIPSTSKSSFKLFGPSQLNQTNIFWSKNVCFFLYNILMIFFQIYFNSKITNNSLCLLKKKKSEIEKDFNFAPNH